MRLFNLIKLRIQLNTVMNERDALRDALQSELYKAFMTHYSEPYRKLKEENKKLKQELKEIKHERNKK